MSINTEEDQIFGRRFEDARRSFGHRWFTIPDLVGHGILHNSLQGETFGNWLRLSQVKEIEAVELGYKLFRYRFRKKEDPVMQKPKSAPPPLVPEPLKSDTPSLNPATDQELPVADLSPVEYQHLCLKMLTNFDKCECVMTSWIREAMNYHCPARAKDKPIRLSKALAQMVRDGLLTPWDTGRARKYALTPLAVNRISELGLLSVDAAERWRRLDVHRFLNQATRNLLKSYKQEARTPDEYALMIEETARALNYEVGYTKAQRHYH